VSGATMLIQSTDSPRASELWPISTAPQFTLGVFSGDESGSYSQRYLLK
jgi:hypothetical protein